MKKLQQFLLLLNMPQNILKVFFVLLLFLKSNFAFSQWQVANSGTTNNIVDICFPTDSIGYAVTDNGDILKTIDEGNNWNVLTTLSGNFTSICALGLDTIFVGGNNIYRSDNGGNSWGNLITLGYTITDLLFFNSQNGILIKPGSYTCTSSQGQVTITSFQALSTTDYGNTWVLSFSELQSYSRFQLINDTTAYVTGAPYYIDNHCNGGYYNIGIKTFDCGNTWSTSNIPGWSYSAFYFVNDTLEYLLGGTTLYRIISSSLTQVRQMTFGVNQLVFVNEIDGYVLNANNIYKTNTQGVVWDVDTTPVSSLSKLLNNSNKAMFALGSNGTILKKHIIESLYPDSVYRIKSSTNSLNFDSAMVGANKVIPVTITNEGNMDLSVSINTSSVFQLSLTDSNYTSIVSFSLLPLRDTILNVMFIPSDTLIFSDTLTISANNVADLKIPIQGRGINDLVGSISGVMNICQDTIKVVGDIIVNNDGKVVICPGTTVLFMGHYKFEVHGALIASGLQNDSIRFTPQDTVNGWGGIQFFDSTASDTSILKFCIIEYGKKPAFPDVRGGGIYFFNHSNVIIERSSICNNYAYYFGGGIYCSYASPIIMHSKIFNNTAKQGGGIYLDGWTCATLILNNEIYNNAAIGNTSVGGGILCRQNFLSPYPNIIQNLIFNNSANYGGGIYCAQSSPNIINNTICNNFTTYDGGGIYCFGNGTYSEPIILNNIIYNNSANQIQYSYNPQPFAKYCDIQGGFSNGIGVINQIPDFANPTDSIGFMYQIGNYDWSLNQNSPCIDAGDTAFNTLIPPLDLAGNPRISQGRIDIGAYEHQQLISVNEIESDNSISLFPNPFTKGLNIFVMKNQEPFQFVLYDLFSRKLLQQEFTNSVSLNTEQLAKGLYLYEVRCKDGSFKKGKVVKD